MMNCIKTIYESINKKNDNHVIYIFLTITNKFECLKIKSS